MKKLLLFSSMLLSIAAGKKQNEKPISVSGIYPELAFYNQEGECGTGAVVPWANRLWVITYGPHQPFGSSDKLYEITPGLQQIVRKESIGGTPANRMIHKESRQLFIGPYAINEKGNVRTIPYNQMPGRHTGNARHLTDPAGKIYYGTMEEGFYEVDVNSLKVKELYKDGNVKRKNAQGVTIPHKDLLVGAHGKGLYSGQGVMLFTNNGESSKEALEKFDVPSGVLAEWNGVDWKVVRRNQFVEVTGPGGIYGNKNPKTDPLWATGWDHKSVLIGVRDYKKGWRFYRLPKASNSYDGAHGWNTEWPRIRNVGTEAKPDYLMTMHGMFWRFPANFTASSSKGIQPRSSYLKVIGDFTRWNDQLVFGCDDSANKEFLNKRTVKGNIEGPGESNSNLWFTSLTQPDHLGTTNAAGAVWLNDTIAKDAISEPFIFEGWENRTAWLKNSGSNAVTFTFEVDKTGTNSWSKLKTIAIEGNSSVQLPFSATDKGCWIRVRSNQASIVSISFVYGEKKSRATANNKIFTEIAGINASESKGGLLYSLGDKRGVLGVLANTTNKINSTETGYYELNSKLQLTHKEDAITVSKIRDKFAIPQKAVSFTKGSVLIIDDAGRRWRLPLSNNQNYKELTDKGMLRVCREVATERDLFNCNGTFYELPAENADGFAKIKPIATHNLRINDYASFRGLLVMTGLNVNSSNKNPHVIVSSDKKAAVWVGAIDDLWKLGKPVGEGGPWIDEPVVANTPSDPYLIANYDRKTLQLSHKSNDDVRINVEVDPIGNGDWVNYTTCTVQPNQTLTMKLPANVQARWIRFRTNTDCTVTTWLSYM